MYRVIEREGRTRVDTATKILGKTQFTNEVSLPGMLTALCCIRHDSRPWLSLSRTARRLRRPA